MKFKLTVLLLTMLFIVSSFAKEKWGKVPKEILQQQTFTEDPEAEAVILFDLGEMTIVDSDRHFWMVKKIHKRIKIVTEAGKKYATIRIPYYHEDKLEGLKGQVFLPNGKKIKMKKKHVHEEESGKYTRTKVFVLPGVEVGSVFEYKYELRSKYIHDLDPWYFQNGIYTKLSRMTVLLPEGFSYNVFTTNVGSFEPSPEHEKIKDIHTRKWIGKFVWQYVEMPAIRKEPHMNTLEDYKISLHFQIISYKDQYQYYKYIKEWKDLAENIGEDFNRYIDDTGDIKKLCKKLIGEQPDGGKEQAIELYKFVRDSIKTDRYYRQWKKVDKVLEEKEGTGWAKNMVLISLLRHAGYTANPVLISTKGNGLAYRQVPNVDQFNHIVVKTQIGKFPYYIDASNTFTPFGILPSKDLVGFGFEVADKKGDFKTLKSRKKANIDKCEIKAELTPEGELICKAEMTYLGYIGTSVRSSLVGKDLTEVWEEKLKDSFANVVLDSVKIEEFEDDCSKLKVKVYYKVSDYAQIVGDNVYLPVPFFNKSESNKFKREKRTFNVDYNYAYSELDVLEIKLPDNMTLIELPQNISAKIPGASLNSIVNASGNTISVFNKFKIDKMTFVPKEYKALRNIYSKVVEADQGQIVIKMKAE